MADQTHPSDCALCPLGIAGTHVYVDPTTQARRGTAARAANDRIHDAYHALRGPDAPCARPECSRTDDPTEHDRVSPFVRRALGRTVPPSAHGARAFARS